MAVIKEKNVRVLHKRQKYLKITEKRRATQLSDNFQMKNNNESMKMINIMHFFVSMENIAHFKYIGTGSNGRIIIKLDDTNRPFDLNNNSFRSFVIAK